METVTVFCLDGHKTVWDRGNPFPEGCKFVINRETGDTGYCNKRIGLVEDPPSDEERHENLANIYISDIVHPDAPTTTNERGGQQSHVPVRFDLIDGKALFAMAAVLHEGAEKYAPGNWRLIGTRDHLNHALMHIYAYLSGDRTDDHLSHALCRITFANAVELDPEAGPERDE